MSKMQGIDVSIYQGAIDWQKVKAAGIDFAIVRAGYGRDFPGQDDPNFSTNVAGAQAAGLHVGAYHYSYAKTPEMAADEAAFFLRLIKGLKLDMPVYFDIEDASQKGLGKTLITEIVKAFCSAVEAAGYYTGIYANLDWLNNRLDMSNLPYTAWLAQWTSKPTYKGKFDMWQYTSDGSVDGIGGRVDRNECYIDFPAIIKKAGLNGFGAQEEAPAQENTPVARLHCQCGDLLNTVPCKNVDGTMYIPARAAFETYGYGVEWDGKNIDISPVKKEA